VVTVPPAGPSGLYRPLPSAPSGNPSQGPVITAPQPQPVSGPGPTIQSNPPPLQSAPQPTWSPVQEEGPSLAPPK